MRLLPGNLLSGALHFWIQLRISTLLNFLGMPPVQSRTENSTACNLLT